MTNEEAIKHLKFMAKGYQNLLDNDERCLEAVGKGYKGEAEAQESLADVYKVQIDALNLAIKALEQQSCDACCGGNQKEKAKLCQRSYLMGMQHKAEQQSCEDAVSRKEAIASIRTLYPGMPMADFTGHRRLEWSRKYAQYLECEKTITELPSVTPIRPKGEWETGYTYPDGVYWKCSACKELIRVRIPMHFCSNCGADMKKKGE